MFEAYARLEPRFRKAYDLLFEAFGNREFTFRDAEEVLREYANKNEVLFKLESAGLLEVRKRPEDRRRKTYRLKSLLGRESKILTRDDLINKILKPAADLIRTRVDYRVLLIFLFYKAVSDKFLSKAREYMKEGYSEEDAYSLTNYDILRLYDGKELYVWQRTVNSPEDFINGLYKVVELNQGELKNFTTLIDRTGLPSLFKSDNAPIVSKLLDLFGRYDLSESPYDILGDGYEWVLYYFAPTKAKEGEVYTPLEVSRLIANLIEPTEGEVILDPACGSASMLIEQYLFIQKNKGISEPSVHLVGQEVNDVTAVLAELNFILHGIRDYTVHIGDSLVNPYFEKADKVVINPPWNQDGYDEGTLKQNPKHREIFSFGYTNKQSADWAWIQLVSYFTKKKAGIVIDSGALFRGGKEANIRKLFIERDWIEAVILLPEKIFYNTQAPGVIIVINKEKPQERKGKVLFINASNEFIKHPDVKKLNKLSDENIKEIAEAYRKFENIEGFARVVTKDEISKNDYNLNVSLYVNPLEEDEEINLEEEFRKLEKLTEEYDQRYKTVRGYIQEMLRVLSDEEG